MLRLERLLIALLLITGLFFVGRVLATAPADPYADAVQGFSSIGVVDPENTLGAPDDNYSTVLGINRFITLDMGAGEEGKDTLRVYFGNIAGQVDLRVIFLDGSLSEISRQNRQVSAQLASESSQDFNYNASEPYRYVRLESLVAGGFTLDAVAAMDYVGKPGGQVPPPTGGNGGSGGNGGDGGNGGNGAGQVAAPNWWESMTEDIANWWDGLAGWWQENCSWISLLLLVIVALETGYLVASRRRKSAPASSSQPKQKSESSS